MKSDKVEIAIAVINQIRNEDPKKVEDVIVALAGEPLALFFHSYSRELILKSTGPDEAAEVGASLMLMGYIIAKREQLRPDFTVVPPTLS